MTNPLGPIHPGEVLLEDFMKPLNLSAYRVAKDLGVAPLRITQIIHRAIGAETALLLSRYKGTSPQFWINLQGQYDLEIVGSALSKKLATFRSAQTRAERLSVCACRPKGENPSTGCSGKVETCSVTARGIRIQQRNFQDVWTQNQDAMSSMSGQ
jgi:antitoxin HigA-1